MAGNTSTGRWSDRRGWLVAFFIASTAHAGIYQQLSNITRALRVADNPSMVTVSLVAAPEPITQPEPEPKAVTPPPPEPVAAARKPKPRPKPVKKVKPVESEPVERKVVPERIQPKVASAPVPSERKPVSVEPPVVLPRADAAYLRNPPPNYPRMMLRRGVEGTVLVRAQVMDDGSCHHVQLKTSSGHRLLDEAALAAVKGWHFMPARKGNQAIVAWVDVPIEFKISRTQ